MSDISRDLLALMKRLDAKVDQLLAELQEARAEHARDVAELRARLEQVNGQVRDKPRR